MSITLDGTLGITSVTGSASLTTAGPAFSAYSNTNQSITASTLTKVQINTKVFDTNSNYDNTTNYRFTPTVAGYYKIIGRVDGQASGAITRLFSTIFKNGAEYSRGVDAAVTLYGSIVTSLIYLNGTTDYVELYAFINGTTPAIQNGSTLTYFQGSLIRSA